MKKTIILTLLCIVSSMSMRAADYQYLVFTMNNGSTLAVTATDLTISFANDNLIATSGNETLATLPLATLASMEFSNDNGTTAINVVSTDRAVLDVNSIITDANTAIYDMQGRMMPQGSALPKGHVYREEQQQNNKSEHQMKKIFCSIAAMLTIAAATAQTLNVTTSGATYQFPATQTGKMTFADGSTTTIMGRTFNIGDITTMYTDNSDVSDNEVNITYNGTGALVFVAGNIAQYVDVTVSGAHVTITQSEAVTNDLINDGTLSEITYNLDGASDDGSLTLGGDAKCTVTLNGLTLTNPNGAPINITNGKRIAMSVKKGTENTLKDGTASSKGLSVLSGTPGTEGQGRAQRLCLRQQGSRHQER